MISQEDPLLQLKASNGENMVVQVLSSENVDLGLDPSLYEPIPGHVASPSSEAENIRKEQDKEFLESLKADKKKDRLKREAEEKRIQEELEHIQKEQEAARRNISLAQIEESYRVNFVLYHFYMLWLWKSVGAQLTSKNSIRLKFNTGTGTGPILAVFSNSHTIEVTFTSSF